jgi:hypothetical protein
MEHIVDTFSNGIKNMVKNPILFLPMFIYFLLICVLSIIFGLMIAEPLVAIIEGEEVSVINWLLLGLVSFLFLLVMTILSSYVSAGTIGMVKESVLTGRTKFKDLFTYGNKFTVRIFFATLLMSFLELVMILFWLPTIYIFINSEYTILSFFETLLMNPEDLMPLLATLMIPILIGCLLTIVYSIIIYVAFYFVTYALVVDNLSVIASFKKSYALFRQHPFSVLIFILIIYVITSIFSNIVSLISIMPLMMVDPIILNVSLLLLLIIFVATSIYTVAITVWATRFYMGITEKELYTK